MLNNLNTYAADTAPSEDENTIFRVVARYLLTVLTYLAYL